MKYPSLRLLLLQDKIASPATSLTASHVSPLPKMSAHNVILTTRSLPTAPALVYVVWTTVISAVTELLPVALCVTLTTTPTAITLAVSATMPQPVLNVMPTLLQPALIVPVDSTLTMVDVLHVLLTAPSVIVKPTVLSWLRVLDMS